MPAPAQPAIRRTALIAGASGLVGSEILRGLLADPACQAVHSIGRRQVGLSPARLTQHLVDFTALPPLPPLTEAYIALGSTIQQAGSKTAFRAVDFDAFIAVAGAALSAGATKIGVVSAMAADAHSAIFYNRVKGEMEQALGQMGFDVLVIARPALLAGNRAALKQPARAGESAGLRVLRWIAPVVPANYRPIAAQSVARALLAAVPSCAPGRHLLLSGAMQQA